MLGKGGMCIYRVHEPKPFVAMGCICTAFSTLLEGHDLGLSKLRRVNGIYQVSRRLFKCKGIIASEDSRRYLFLLMVFLEIRHLWDYRDGI